MFIKLCNLGRDAEVRFTSSGTAVTSFPCAYSIGYGDKKRPSGLMLFCGVSVVRRWLNT